MRVAIVHDDLVQWGGAERVLDAICELFPEAPIYTSVYDSSNKLLADKFKNRKVITSFVQKIPFWQTFYKALLPLYPIAFEQFDFSKYDLVISQTTRFAKSIITKPNTKHICYCHTPPRFLWNFSGENTPKILSFYFSFLRDYDLISARRVDNWLAGSKNCQARIKKIYKANSNVLQPFVDMDRLQDVETFDGGYYLIIARLNRYKRVDIAVDAFNENKKKLYIVGIGPELEKLQSQARKNIRFLGSLSEKALVNVLSGCKALIVTGEEDFGLTPLEAQALGKPVIAYKAGGALETVAENETGILYPEQSKQSLVEALENFDKVRFTREKCIENAKRFSKKVFQKRFLGMVL